MSSILIYALGFILMIGVISLGLKKPSWLFDMMLLSLLGERLTLIDEPFALNAFNGLLIATLAVITVKYNRILLDVVFGMESFLVRMVSIALTAYLFVCVFYIMIQPYRNVALGVAFNAFGMWSLFVVTLFFMSRKDGFYRTGKNVLLVALVAACVGVLQSVELIPTIGRTGAPRFGMDIEQSLGVFVTAGTYGMILVSALVFALSGIWLGRNQSKFKTIGAIFYITVITIAIVISQSRSTYLAVIASIFYVFSAVVLVRKGMYILLFILFGVIAAMNMGKIITYSNNIVEQRYQSVESRIETNQNALEEIRENVLFGTGRDTSFMEAYRNRGVYREISLHNAFLVIMRYGGLVLFLPYFLSVVIPFLLMLIVLAKTTDNGTRMKAVAISAALIGCYIEMNFFMGFSAKMLWILIPMSVAVYEKARSKRFCFRSVNLKRPPIA